MKKMLLLPLLALPMWLCAQVWQPDLGNGLYANPVIHADYSDPDVVRVGEDFYLTASSFGHVPGLPILHSRDLVNWQIVNYAIPRFDFAEFDTPQHGNGVWAPAFRFHQGWFYIFWGDPDRGIFYVRSRDPRAEWEKPVLVKKAYGNIDPCPLWDDDGRVYLVHAFAHSRAGIKSVLQVNELEADLSGIRDKGNLVFDGHKNHDTMEGPKFLKRNGYYYIFTPAGGVATGWQTVLRSRHVLGPYEDRIVLHQGATDINGPHQGAYVELENGEGWFLHFQDVEAYGRIPHLQPVRWVDDWPVIGHDPANSGTGQPVPQHAKPNVGKQYPPMAPQTNDEFDSTALSLAWQWQANPQESWYSLAQSPGKLRLWAYANHLANDNLWNNANLLLQKFPAREFAATTQMLLVPKNTGERAGITILGLEWAALYAEQSPKGPLLRWQKGSAKNAPNAPIDLLPLKAGQPLWLKVQVLAGALCRFAYSLDGQTYQPVDEAFEAKPGLWVGAKVGIFATAPADGKKKGYADFDWFRLSN